MALGIGGKLEGADILDRPLIHHSIRDQPGADQVAKPARRMRVDLVVVRRHGYGYAAALKALRNFAW